MILFTDHEVTSNWNDIYYINGFHLFTVSICSTFNQMFDKNCFCLLDMIIVIVWRVSITLIGTASVLFFTTVTESHINFKCTLQLHMYSHAFHTKKYFFGYILNFNDLFLSIPLTAILSVSDKWNDAEIILLFSLKAFWSMHRFQSKYCEE